MGKKNKKSNDVFGYYNENEDKFESKIKDDLDDYESDDEEVGTDLDGISAADLEVADILKLNVDDLEKGKMILSKEVRTSRKLRL